MTVIATLPRAARNSGGKPSHGDRIAILEGKVAAMESKLDTAVDNSAQILAVLTATRGYVSFAKRYGPRVFIFASGVASAAGIGNPEVLKFISNFFG